MRLTSRQKQATWNRACRMAFWDQPNYSYSAWRQDIGDDNLRILTRSIQYMKPIDFIRLVDIDYFVVQWIQWRGNCRTDKLKTNCILLDGLWSDYVMDNALVIPNDELLSLTKKQKETYNIVTQYPYPLSMYELAKIAQRQYRRVFDDINVLVQKKLFRKIRTKRNNRTVDLIGVAV